MRAEGDAGVRSDPAAVHGEDEEEDDPEQRHDPAGDGERARAEQVELELRRRGGRGGRGARGAGYGVRRRPASVRAGRGAHRADQREQVVAPLPLRRVDGAGGTRAVPRAARPSSCRASARDSTRPCGAPRRALPTGRARRAAGATPAPRPVSAADGASVGAGLTWRCSASNLARSARPAGARNASSCAWTSSLTSAPPISQTCYGANL